MDFSISRFKNFKIEVVAIQNTIELLSKFILLDVNKLNEFKVDVKYELLSFNFWKSSFI